jgi:hypothetical protein
MTDPAITYNWKIERLDCAPSVNELSNVVRKIHWRLFASDGINTSDLYGDILLGDADPEDFTAYESLTEAEVVAWLEAAIDARADEEEPSVPQMRSGLAGILAAMRTPAVVATPLPW